MSRFFALLKYELFRWVISPATYMIFFIFCASLLAIFAFVLHDYAVHTQPVPFVQMFFMCFWLPTAVCVPVITMRTFSEDYKNGMIQAIFSTSVTPANVVLAKFIAAYFIFVSFWAASLFFFKFGMNSGMPIVHDAAFAMEYNIGGAMAFIATIGTFFVAVGIFASSLTENQIVASMTTFSAIIAGFLGGQVLANRTKLSNMNFFDSSIGTFNIFYQLDNFCNGVFDTRVVVLYASACALVLSITCATVRKC